MDLEIMIAIIISAVVGAYISKFVPDFKNLNVGGGILNLHQAKVNKLTFLGVLVLLAHFLLLVVFAGVLVFILVTVLSVMYNL